MPATDTTEQAPAVDRPLHPLAEMTTYELAGYGKDLQRAIAFFDRKTPVPAARGVLQDRLDAVLEEQAERERIRHGG